MNHATSDLIIVTPVHEDAEASSRLFQELAAELDKDVFLVVVDDGSVRQPLDAGSLEAAGLNGVILKLRRNVGHQRAIAIGLGYVAETIGSYQRVVVMDSDGEDLPSTIADLLKPLESEQVDVVVAKRTRRVQTLRFKIFYWIYRQIFRMMTGREISFGNFMALKPVAVNRLVAMQELSIHVAGSVIASRLRTVARPLHRGPRYASQSKMNFVSLALHGFKALMVFAEDVLVRVGIACALIACLSVFCAVVAIGLKSAGIATPGWFSVAFGILVLMFLQTGALALITLMLTGVVHAGSVTNAISYRDFVGSIIEAKPAAEPSR
jgi:glycosyltransferase involved in cell wall biosynthesis